MQQRYNFLVSRLRQIQLSRMFIVIDKEGHKVVMIEQIMKVYRTLLFG